ncbi:MAG: hypothetical protein C0443_11330 [Comamonadaceae bacterium]|nr:hypothetical protein [Comamonadaceae bacterium]
MAHPRRAARDPLKGATRAARQSRFRRVREQDTCAREMKLVQGTAEPALPGRQCRPLEGVTRKARRRGEPISRSVFS